MAEKKFTFDGAITEELPYIGKDAFKDLSEGSLINGVVDYVERIKGIVYAGVMINEHTTRVALWDTTLEDARKDIKRAITLKYNGYNDEGWPVLYVRW